MYDEPPAPIRAITYARVSTSMQATNGLSLDGQRAQLAAEVERRGWTLVDATHDVASGASTRKRPGLGDTLDRLDDGEADVLLATRLDRLSRSVVDFSKLMERALAGGWRVVVLDTDIDTTTPNGELITNILASVAQWERRMIAQRVMEGLAERRRQGGRLGMAPLVSPNIVRRIRRERLAGRTLRQIAERLTHDGVPTPSGRSTSWSHSTVQAVLRRA